MAPECLRITHKGRVYLGVSHVRLPSQCRASQLWVYLCLYPLTQNDQIRHGNNWGGACYQVSHAIAFAEMRRAVLSDSFLLFCEIFAARLKSANVLYLDSLSRRIRPPPPPPNFMRQPKVSKEIRRRRQRCVAAAAECKLSR